MKTLRFLLPFSYFAQSRLKQIRDLLFHAYYEWMLNIILLLYLTDASIIVAFQQFLLCYLSFIAIYELGYLYNDVESVRFDPNPRRRIKDFNPTNIQLLIWSMVRLATFGGVTYYLGFYDQWEWWGWYAVLIVAYALHNTYKNKQLKPFTFMNLAMIRFFAPIFMFLPQEETPILACAILLNYVLYRTLTYLDSKDLVNMPDRTKASFKVQYYLLMSGISLLLFILSSHVLVLYVNLYYLAFVGLFFLKEQWRGAQQ